MRCQHPGGLHVLETEYVVEVIDPATGEPVPPGTEGELVLTKFGRPGSPLIRYRTGDLVRVDPRAVSVRPGVGPAGRRHPRPGG